MDAEMGKHRNPYFEAIYEDPQYEVGKVLAQLGWDGAIPIDLMAVCNLFNFEVRFLPDAGMGAPGVTQFFGDGSFRIVINTYNTDCLDGFSRDRVMLCRQRFTLAHEIGHCIYKSHKDVDLQKSLQAPSNPYARSYTRKREAQANLFAANLLVPQKAFDALLECGDMGWQDIGKMARQVSEEFVVSLQVAIQRMVQLADFPCIAVLFGTKGLPVRTPVYSLEFKDLGLFYGKSQPLPKGTLAHGMLLGQNAKRHGRKRYEDASIWFPDVAEWRTEKYAVLETSMSNGKYGIISFIEIEENDCY